MALTLEAFRYHIAGMLFIALNRVIAPAFYSRGDTKAPTYAGIASFALNIALCAALSGPMKGGGIALALSVASAFNTFLLLAAIKRSEVPGCVEAIAPSLPYAGRLLAYSVVALIPQLSSAKCWPLVSQAKAASFPRECPWLARA